MPSLTTVSPDKPGLARAAVKLLIGEIEARRSASGPAPGPVGETVSDSEGSAAKEPTVKEIVIGHTLLIRESSGPKG